MPDAAKPRLAYIDWMRGLACLLMFQTHAYDAWLSDAARRGSFFSSSQLLGSLPAPLFLFLAGISFALVTDRLRRKGSAPPEIFRVTALRGSEILAIAFLFRLQQWSFGLPWAPWTDLLRVDILNLIGLSMLLMALLCRFAASRARSILLSLATAAAIALLTPPVWTTWQPALAARLPWFLESYLNGVHILGVPQPWLFPIFPWMAFSFAGLATGFLLFSDWARSREARLVALLGAAGLVLFFLARWLDSLPFSFYAVYDYWHTSPNYFLARVGVLLMILLLSYVWCRWGGAESRFSPLRQLGQTSLLVYWVHIEFVYGRFSILPHRGATIAQASVGLAVIFVMMLILSMLRTRLKGKGKLLLERWRLWRQSAR